MLNRVSPSDTLHFVRCHTGNKTYGLDMAWVHSIQRADRLRRASEKGTGDAGFVGWLPGRESDIPVFSLTKRLGYTTSPNMPSALQRIIVLPAPSLAAELQHEEEHLWALLVDGVSQVMAVASDRFELLPPVVVNLSRNYFEGVLKLEERLELFLSPEWLHPDTLLYTDGVIQETYQLRRSGAGLNDFQLQQVLIKDVAQNNSTKALPQRNGTALAIGSKRRDDRVRIRPGRLMIFSTQSGRSHRWMLSYGLSVTQIPEILRPLPITSVPAAPDFVLGLVNWRDCPVPVIDLDTRLGLTTQANSSSHEKTRLMIARGASQKTLIGFLIQPGTRVLRLPIRHQPCTRMPALDQNMVKGVFELENEILVIPDVESMLRSDE